MEFPTDLQNKIDKAIKLRKPVTLGKIKFKSNLILAPMAAICNIPYRLLMEDLGAGGTISELISCHGINHGNERTLSMLKIHEKEDVVGIQLFGEDGDAMAKAALKAQEFNPLFLDINMGCPVKKVVSKGGGSALLKNLHELGPFLNKVKKVCNIPLSIKIRTGWESDQINADEIVNIAYNEGIEWVAIHGRTRAQQYTGQADWDYIESLCDSAKLPIIGNGDLHESPKVFHRSQITKCDGLMIARGALRNPFIFLESLDPSIQFCAQDYWPVIKRLDHYTTETFPRERTRLIQMKKLIVWFATGFPKATKFRSKVFETKNLPDMINLAEDYFLSLGATQKRIDFSEQFMNSGHG